MIVSGSSLFMQMPVGVMCLLRQIVRFVRTAAQWDSLTWSYPETAGLVPIWNQPLLTALDLSSVLPSRLLLVHTAAATTHLRVD